jgi:hypothetical protein
MRTKRRNFRLMTKLLKVNDQHLKDIKLLSAMADKRSVKQYLEDLLEQAIKDEIKRKLKK